MSKILDKITFNLQGDEYVLRSTEILAIAYEDLRSRRDNSELVPGMWYRITDYRTTTTQENTSTAGHPFEILVQALTENTLSENAKAHVKKYELLPIDSLEVYSGEEYIGIAENTYEMGSGYFSHTCGPGGSIDLSIGDNYGVDDRGLYLAHVGFQFYFKPEQEYIYINNLNYATNDNYFNNSNLSAWEIKYCLDNDSSRFAWADSGGFGVIYYMKDEFGNEAGYDFKNIKFHNIVDINTNYSKDSLSKCVIGDLNVGSWGNEGQDNFLSGIFRLNTYGLYTFEYNGNDASFTIKCCNNKIESYNRDGIMCLPNNVLEGAILQGNTITSLSHDIYLKVSGPQGTITGICCSEGTEYLSVVSNVTDANLEATQFEHVRLSIFTHGLMTNCFYNGLNRCICLSQSHVKANNMFGNVTDLKLHVNSWQNNYFMGYINSINIYGSYVLGGYIFPHTSLITLFGGKWIENFQFTTCQNLTIGDSEDAESRYYNLIFTCGNYNNKTITELNTNSDISVEYKPQNTKIQII